MKGCFSMKKNLIEDYIGQTQEERDKIAFELQKSPFDEWVQLNKQGLQHLMLLNTISPLATNILYFLIKNMAKCLKGALTVYFLLFIHKLNRISPLSILKIFPSGKFLATGSMISVVVTKS